MYSIYGGYDIYGAIRYVGITCRDVAIRAAEHLYSGDPNKLNLFFQEIHKVPDLLTAKGSEQTYIDTYGLAKNGGQLVNQINSVAPGNPILQQAKDNAQAIGAVPGTVSIVGSVLGTIGAALTNPLILMIDPSDYLLHNQPQQVKI